MLNEKDGILEEGVQVSIITDHRWRNELCWLSKGTKYCQLIWEANLEKRLLVTLNQSPFGRSVSRSVSQPVSQSVGQPVGQSIGQLVSQSVGQLVNTCKLAGFLRKVPYVPTYVRTYVRMYLCICKCTNVCTYIHVQILCSSLDCLILDFLEEFVLLVVAALWVVLV